MDSLSSNGVGLSDDMVIEILTRLPLKSIYRSKCVSNSWHTLISDDYVRSKLPLIVSGVFHPTLKNQPQYVTTSNANNTFQELNISSLVQSDQHDHNSALIDCCNGLLLLYSSVSTAFQVCNPSTSRLATLPKPTKTTKLSILAFDPYHSKHFKVVNFTSWLARGAELELFDSESGTWAEREVHWGGLDTDALSATMRYVEGVLYIIAHPKQIVAIDLETMDCDVIELPDVAKNECCVGKLEGRLRYVINEGGRLKVWMMKGEEWVLKHCVEVKMRQFRVVGVHPEREWVYLWVNGRLVAYDVGEERVEEVWEVEKGGYLMQVWVFAFSRNVEECLACVEW